MLSGMFAIFLGLFILWLIPIWGCASWANSKGRNPWVGALIGFIFSYLGLLFVALIPANHERQLLDLQAKHQLAEARRRDR